MKIIDIKKNNLEYLSSFQIEYEDKKNNVHKWEIISRGNIERVKKEIYEGKSYNDAVQIVAYNKTDKTIILIKEFRVSQNRFIYSLPAGLIDKNENIYDAAKREFFEETGLTLKPTHYDKERYTSIGISDEKVSTVYGEYSGEISTQYQEDTEIIFPLKINKSQAIKLLENEEISMRAALFIQNIFNLNFKIF